MLRLVSVCGSEDETSIGDALELYVRSDSTAIARADRVASKKGWVHLIERAGAAEARRGS
ncbi:MAG: hypothetical protein KF838_07295 [Phycisphaeraceae bacterium]|nr:MAG: hypothetical protein KF838_07295 [Phycisphaeraceae bacterium]